MQDDTSVEDFWTFCKGKRSRISRLLDKLIKLLYKYQQSKHETSFWTNSMTKTANTNIAPLFSNVLIRPLEAEEKTASGIILPDTVKEKPQMGEVMAVGQGEMDDGEIVKNSMVVKIGDKVMYKKWGGNEVKVENEEWTIVEQKDILAIIK